MNVTLNTKIKVDCRFCPIRHRAVCSSCDTAELELLNGIKSYKSVPAGQTVARRGEPCDFVGSIVTGVAMLSQSMEDGRTQMVGLLLASDFIGRPGRTVLPHDVVAATDLVLCCFQRAPFEKLLEDVPHLRERLLEMALDHLDAAREWMLLLGRKSAREKLASFLLLIARRSVAADGHVRAVDLPLSREEIANYLGLTIETVSRQLAGLKKAGLIGLDGARRIEIFDFAALQTAAGGALHAET
ncbi:MAG: Crp/Fnr family transcriptional regulator [Pseudomonadota bacterium]